MNTKRFFLLQKLYTLFTSDCFHDFTFNCKDGKVTANRAILAVYSDFLKNLFEECPNIVKHPLLDDKDFGVNLPVVNANHLDLLLKVIYANGSTKLSHSDFKNVRIVAKVLHINLKTINVDRSFVTIEPIPDGYVENQENEQVFAKTRQILINKSKKSSAVVAAAGAGGDRGNTSGGGGGSGGDDDIGDGNNVSDNDCTLNNGEGILAANAYNGDDDSEGAGSEFLEASDAEDMDTSEMAQTSQSNVCTICNVTCKTWRGLRSHMGHVHRTSDMNKSLNQPKVVCKCGSVFALKSRKVWKQHKQNCEAFKKDGVMCDVCNMAFDSHYAMKTHQHSVHGIVVKARTCECGEAFDDKQQYREHLNTCETYRSLAVICDDCDVPFLNKGHLIRHLKASNHRCRKFEEDESFRFLNPPENSDRFVCKCGKTYSTNSRNKIRAHSRSCPEYMANALFLCDICETPFDDMLSFNNHKFRAHGILTGAKTCVCGNKFTNYTAYRKHTVSCAAYKEIAVFCVTCNIPFATQRHLQAHLESGAHNEIVCVGQ